MPYMLNNGDVKVAVNNKDVQARLIEGWKLVETTKAPKKAPKSDQGISAAQADKEVELEEREAKLEADQDELKEKQDGIATEVEELAAEKKAFELSQQKYVEDLAVREQALKDGQAELVNAKKDLKKELEDFIAEKAIHEAGAVNSIAGEDTQANELLELRAKAKDLKILGYAQMKKETLITKIAQTEEDNSK